MFFNYFIPTRIMFGKGQLNHLHECVPPGDKALVVISTGKSTRENGYLDRLIGELKLAGVDYVVYDKIQPNPTKASIMDGAVVARESDCDFVIGLGGGSVMDASKSIAIMATNDGDYWDYVFGGSGKGKPVQNAPLPVVAISTTAGTGSETDPWTVITKEETNEKIGFGYDRTFPVLALVDPDLMLSVPPMLTAYQGFDALFHATEAYISKSANPMSDLYALKAIELVSGYLPRAVKDGKDEEARANVALANTLSGMVLSSCFITSEHSLEHALSAFHPDLPHGAGLIMLSRAYYTHFVKAGACDERMIAMARAMGKKDADKPMDFVDALVELQQACGVASLRMSDYGIRRDELRKYAINARETMGDLFAMDPAPLSEDDCVAILESAYQ
ncbi:iron-containing alcohol dehydrogenase [Oxalobacter vibrioformis]|uniref:Iron-containing alcohol dehydrogenase n=1 Tax=Oxalobacter vibrioformis TaxID=933080 RepID=A0A9E9LZH0_9BURK|nr:iron-containing alcohol dehydrogenase [Oxalobacter vibrioformis]WAW10495.1 iron-containing alcohol dehydrogenase [Oxalobacter vibrioformis]